VRPRDLRRKLYAKDTEQRSTPRAASTTSAPRREGTPDAERRNGTSAFLYDADGDDREVALEESVVAGSRTTISCGSPERPEGVASSLERPVRDRDCRFRR
jgi:hypothetical protein